MKKFFSLFIIAAVLLAPLAHAEDVWSKAQSDQYGKKAGGMLGRGFVNLVTCFVDVIVATVEGTKKGPPVIGTVAGLGSGIGCTALRALSGALDIVTFWVPDFNGFPVCRSYANCIDCQEDAVVQTPEAAPSGPVTVPAGEPAPVQDGSPMQYVKK